MLLCSSTDAVDAAELLHTVSSGWHCYYGLFLPCYGSTIVLPTLPGETAATSLLHDHVPVSHVTYNGPFVSAFRGLETTSLRL